MAILCSRFSLSTSRFSQPLSSSSSSSSSSPCCHFFRTRFSSLPASMDSGDELRAKFMEFPYISGAQRNLMLELVSSVETRFGPSLQHCTLPLDVQHFENPTGTASASLHLRSGLPSSQIDFILGGWIHCKLPSGGALNITSLSAYLKASTDAPHFLLDLIRSSPTSLVLILDLTPRKDLILYPDYLKTFYEDTQLDRHRQRLHMIPGVRPYVSQSLYIRAFVSPTAILVSIDSESSEDAKMEEIIRDHVSPIAKEMLQFWMESCAGLERNVGEPERAYLAERDGIMKNKTIEVDLGSSLPRLFGQEVADRVLGVLKEYVNK